MTENLTILKKGLILLIIPLLALVAFIALIFQTTADVARAQRWALHSKEVIARAEGIFRKLVEAHSDVRGLLLTGNPIFSDHAEQTQRDVPREIDALEKLVADNPVQWARARAISTRARALIAWQERSGRLFLAGKREEALDHVKDLKGKNLLDDVRGAIDDFLGQESRLDTERMNDLIRITQRQVWAIVGGGLVAIPGVVILAVALGRGITSRFAVLADNAGRLAEGKELVTPLEGRDEIAQLDRVFHSMARAIAEKNRENEMFIYSVSHDLRSPLVNLQGFSQELGHAAKDLHDMIESAELPATTKKRAAILLDQDIAGSIQFIQTAVSRLSAIIDALLRLSRAGRVEYRWQQVDVNATVGRVVEALGSTIAERRATVASKPLPKAWGDPTAVEQIFANLIGNAVNYLDPERPGFIEVGVVDESASPIQTYYVKDNGRGIPEAGMAKLFLAFQRFHDGAARGEGIGLALVRRIVERHGGKIRVESTLGAGSTFYVDLPGGPPEIATNGASPQSFENKGVFA